MLFVVVNMPRRTERPVVIEDLQNTLAARTISKSMHMIGSDLDSTSSENKSSSSESSDEGLDSVSTLYNCVLSQRYFAERHHERVDSSRLASDILRMNPNRFKARFRMSPSAFERIWDMIKDHNIFTNDSNNAQFDHRLQFLVILFRFGAYGNGASRANVAASFHVSTGVLSKFTKRIMVALLSLEKNVVCWPNAAEKKSIKLSIEESHGFPHIIGIMDGTHVILAAKPSYQGEQYFNRKSRYSISCMIVNDHNCRIMHLHAGFPGSAHDSRVFTNSKIWLHHADFFNSPEYILTDTSYPLTAITLPPYKVPALKKKGNQRFNKYLSSIRVRSEHTIGQLKGRFQSLRGIPTVISGKETHTLVVLWIRSCAVLHNLLLEDGYDYSNWEGTQDPDVIASEESPDESNVTLGYNDQHAKEKRELIKADVLRYHGHET